jgi:hypothetical protein
LSYDDLLAFAKAARPRIAALASLVASAPEEAADIELAVEALQLAIAELDDADEEAEESAPEEQVRGGESAPVVAPTGPSILGKRARSAAMQPRVVAGQQLRAVLKQILSFEASNKLAAARALEQQAQAESGVQPEEAKRRAELAKKRAQQMRTQFFSLGNWQLTADVLSRFLSTPEFKRLLPGSARQTRTKEADAKFAAELLAAAKRFWGASLARLWIPRAAARSRT